MPSSDSKAPSKLNERFVSREEFNNSIADEAAQSCVDWADPERRKEALRYIVKQIWDEAKSELEADLRELREALDKLIQAGQAMRDLRGFTYVSQDWDAARCALEARIGRPG